jgi:hypothetical protein
MLCVLHLSGGSGALVDPGLVVTVQLINDRALRLIEDVCVVTS